MKLINLMAYGIHWFGKALILLFLWPYWIEEKSNIEGGTPTDVGVLVLTILWLIFLAGLIAWGTG